METTLLVTPEKLNTTASSFSAKATQVKSMHDEMLNKVNALSSSWTGNASDAYRSKFAALQTSMDKINRMIMEHVNDLKIMAEQYTAAETSAISAADDLPSSTLD